MASAKTEMMLLACLSITIILILLQLAVQLVMGPAVATGDECDYISCGNAADPHNHGLFLRVPLMAWMSKQAHRYSSNPENCLRSVSRIASGISIICCMLSAHIIAGIQAAAFTGFLLLIMPGRIILSRHIWPDIWLGLWLSLTCLILLYPDLSSTLRALSLGLVACMAFLTRFDALLLAPFSGFALAPLPLLEWLLVLLPTLMAFALLSIRNFRRYRIPWPDNTWMFNFMVAAKESENKQANAIHISQEIKEVVKVWSKQEDSSHFSTGMTSVRKLSTQPIRVFSGVLMKLWASLGPDSFVLHRLLPPEGAAYPKVPASINRALKAALTIAFPVFISITALALMVSEAPVSIVLWPTLAFIIPTLIHNRTRYRQAWLPGAALLLVAAISDSGFWLLLSSNESILKWAGAIVLVFMLICLRVRPESLAKS